MSDINKDKLNYISKDIRDVISKRQNELELSFIEDTHTYYIKNIDNKVVSNFPSVSTVIEQFYNKFPTLDKSYELSNMNLIAQDKLLDKWSYTGDYANNKGSRVHYLLEMELLSQYGSYKEVRKPIFECNDDQIRDGDLMVSAGIEFIKLMHKRGAVLIDTEMVLGSSKLGYTGQPDKVWLILDKLGNLGFIITDWKTNKSKNFEVHSYTKPMLSPFQGYMDTSLAHYMIQLPLYARLLIDMFKGTKFESIKFFGSVIVHLNDDGSYKEIRVDKKISDIVLSMDPLPRIREVYEYKEKEIKRDLNRKESLKYLLRYLNI